MATSLTSKCLLQCKEEELALITDLVEEVALVIDLAVAEAEGEGEAEVEADSTGVRDIL